MAAISLFRMCEKAIIKTQRGDLSGKSGMGKDCHWGLDRQVIMQKWNGFKEPVVIALTENNRSNAIVLK